MWESSFNFTNTCLKPPYINFLIESQFMDQRCTDRQLKWHTDNAIQLITADTFVFITKLNVIFFRQKVGIMASEPFFNDIGPYNPPTNCFPTWNTVMRMYRVFHNDWSKVFDWCSVYKALCEPKWVAKFNLGVDILIFGF